MEERNIVVNFPYIDSFTIQTLERILIFEQYLKHNLGFKNSEVFILKPIY
jgi:hypothetical protein